MQNQNECDHVVGNGGICETVLVRLHDIMVYPQIMKFNYCPNCGAKIDWVKIKEELDDKQKTK